MFCVAMSEYVLFPKEPPSRFDTRQTASKEESVRVSFGVERNTYEESGSACKNCSNLQTRRVSRRRSRLTRLLSRRELEKGTEQRGKATRPRTHLAEATTRRGSGRSL